MALNIGLSGQPFIGPDIGGFAQNGDGALFARWMGLGALLPFARGHTGKENIDKEPWAFGPEVERACRLAIERRYRLMPFLYTLFEEASRTGLPVARPLFFADPADAALRSEDDAFLLGDSVLVAAQVVPDRTRAPAMPRRSVGAWREFDFGDRHADLPRLFLRPGAIVPAGPVMEHTGEKPLDPLTLLVCLDDRGEARGELYEDAGDGFGYQRGEFVRSRFAARRGGGGQGVTVTIESAGGDWALPDRPTVVRLLTEGGERSSEPTRGATIVVPAVP
jgi:alpha-glucosidase